MDNQSTMCDFLDNHNEGTFDLEITEVDGTYAQGKNVNGEEFAIRAMGDGDSFNHRVTFEKLA